MYGFYSGAWPVFHGDGFLEILFLGNVALRLEFRMKSFLALAAIDGLKFESGIPGIYAADQCCRNHEMSQGEENGQLGYLDTENRHRRAFRPIRMEVRTKR